MDQNDSRRLQNMLGAAKEAAGLARARSRGDLDTDKRLTLSLLESLETIADNASKVSRDCRNGCEPIPWEQVVEMKQQVVHTYWDIDRDWIWERVREDIPPLIRALEILLST